MCKVKCWTTRRKSSKEGVSGTCRVGSYSLAVNIYYLKQHLVESTLLTKLSSSGSSLKKGLFSRSCWCTKFSMSTSKLADVMHSEPCVACSHFSNNSARRGNKGCLRRDGGHEHPSDLDGCQLLLGPKTTQYRQMHQASMFLTLCLVLEVVRPPEVPIIFNSSSWNCINNAKKTRFLFVQTNNWSKCSSVHNIHILYIPPYDFRNKCRVNVYHFKNSFISMLSLTAIIVAKMEKCPGEEVKW